MNYKAVFRLDNGIEGEVKLTAKNDGDAFMAGCKMFALFDKVEWEIKPMTSIFYPRNALEMALAKIESAELKVDMTLDHRKGFLSKDEWDKDEAITELEDVKEQFEYSKDCIKRAAKHFI